MLQGFRYKLQAKPNRQCSGKDHHVAAVPTNPGQHIDTRCCHHAEHDNNTPTKHVDWNCTDNCTDRWDETTNDQEDRADRYDVTAHNTGHRDQSDVLTKGGVGQTTENPGNRCTQSIRISRAGNLIICCFAPCTTFGNT